jgi:hypothetical protein
MQTITLTEDALSIAAGAFAITITAREIAHNWDALSHYPDRRARLELRELAARLEAFGDYLRRIAESGGAIDVAAEAEQFARRQIELSRAYWNAESRCASAFITGPARFPVERNRKRLDSADSRGREIGEHAKAARKAVERRAFPHGVPGGAIRGSNPDAPDLLRREIAKKERVQEIMKAVNAAIRGAKSSDPERLAQAVVDAVGWSHTRAAAVVQPGRIGGMGFPHFALSNNLAEIKRLKGRLASIEAKRERGTQEASHNTTAGRVERVENVEADRLQLIFPGKPDETVRNLLKSNGFRWAPSEGAWQRHLNSAGRWAADRVIGALQQEANP